MRINEVDKHLSHVELDQLEIFADRLFAKVGIDVEFTRHFLDRVNDERNVKQITASELTRLFKQEYKRWGKPIAQLGPDAEAVMKDLATDLNIPFALRWDSANNELDLIAKTVMRKKNFKTSNREFEVQSVDYSLDNTQHKQVFESIQQLNEIAPAAPIAIAMPIAVIAYEAYVAYRYTKAAWYIALGAKATATTVAAYIVSRSDEFGWLERKMAASAIVAQQLWDKSLDIVGLGKEVDAVVVDQATALNTELTAGIETLTNKALETNELSPATLEIINSVNASAALMNQQLADGVDPSEIASTYISSLGASTAGVEGAAEPNSAVGQTITSIAKVSPAVAAAISAEMEANYQAASGAEAAEIARQLKITNQTIADAAAKSAAQTQASDASLIALATKIAQTNAATKSAAQTQASDDRLITLATKIASANAAAALEKSAADQTAHDTYQNDRIASIAGASDAEAALAKSTADQTAHDTYQNDRIDSIAAASDANALKDRLAKLSAEQQAAHAAYQNARIADIASTSDADAEAALKARAALKLATAAQAAFDAELYAMEISNKKVTTTANNTTSHHDTSMTVPAATATITGPTTSHHDTSMTVPAAGAATTITGPTTSHHDTSMTVPAAAAISHAATNDGGGNTSGKKRTGKKTKWKLGGGGDPEYWDTNLYRWQQKYGTFENTNLIKKYFMINEGGAMPGVGAVHIDEINPTLEALEKSIGIDLKNHVLGSVGKREFSGDIDVALDIKTEELPAFVEALKKNPLVLDIAKSSVIMTKVKIADFDESKTDGRPRTGFVQIDFMPGDPGWMKTYYHSPSDKESKYKGVYRNIMIASMAAVLDRQMSDAKLDDGRAMEERRYMWSPTEGLLRVKRTPVPKKSGEGYTKKNNNETIEGPWKQPDEIAKVLKLDSSADLNSFESLLTAMKKNWTKEAQAYVIQGFKDNHVIKDVGIPDEIKDEL